MSGFRYLPAVLMLLAVAALASENLSHYPIGVLSLLGVAALIRDPKSMLGSADARLLLSVFACLWIPMLLALTDAADPARAAKTTGFYLHFLPAGLYIAHMLSDPGIRRIVITGTAAIVGFWCVDGIIQLVSGRDLFGYPYDGSVLKGVFYPKQRFGLILAVFTPLYIHVVQRFAARSPFAWLLLAPLVVAIAFSLKRTAWMMLFVAVALYLATFFRATTKNVRTVALVAVVCVAALFAAMSAQPNLKTQIAGTLNVFSSDFETADIATSRRLSLWKTGLAVAQAHWINGVGPRGYRTVYRDFAPSDDFWIARGTKGQTHPHLMVLEVLIETGVIGLLGYGFALVLLLKRLWSSRIADPASSACLMVALVAWFPFNAHLAFYGSYWSNIAWLMLALGCTMRPSAENVRA